jgi:hypothetical protein
MLTAWEAVVLPLTYAPHIKGLEHTPFCSRHPQAPIAAGGEREKRPFRRQRVDGGAKNVSVIYSAAVMGGAGEPKRH